MLQIDLNQEVQKLLLDFDAPVRGRNPVKVTDKSGHSNLGDIKKRNRKERNKYNSPSSRNEYSVTPISKPFKPLSPMVDKTAATKVKRRLFDKSDEKY